MDFDRFYTNEEYNQIAQQFRAASSGPTADPQKLAEITRKYPWMKPETALTLGRYNASDAAIDIVGEQAAMRELDDYERKKNTQGDVVAPLRYVFDGLGWLKKGTSAAVDFILPELGETALKRVALPFAKSGRAGQIAAKGAIRWISAIGDIAPETAANIGSMVAGSSNYDLLGLWESTSLAVMLENWQDTGSGYFMNQTLREEQAKRARAFRGTIYGNAFTIGRGLTSFAGEGSLAYKYGSGIIDAAVLLSIPDPTKYLAKGIYAIGQGTKVAGGVYQQIKLGEDINAALKAGGGIRGLVPLMSRQDASAVKTALRASTKDLHGEAGLLKELSGESVDGTKFLNFMNSNPLARRLVDHLVEEDSAKNILEDVFRYEISNETAAGLATAKTREEVISVLTEPFTLGDRTLNAKIGRYRVNQPFKYIRQSRFFTQMPKSTIVTSSDDPLENTESVRNMILSMRTAGVAENKISSWADKAIGEFSKKGTGAGRKNIIDEYDNVVREVMRANGVEEIIINRIMENASAGIERMRTYFINRVGLQTDNGHLAMMAQIVKDNIDDKVLAETMARALPLGDEIAFAGPATISQLLSRVQVLPDARELRRVTRNPLFQQLFSKVGLGEMGKLPIAGRRAKVQVERYRNPARAEELKKIVREQQALDPSQRNQDLYEQAAKDLGQMTYTEEIRTITGQPRRLIDAIDFVQNKIWKPLNLATVGYIVRNGIDAQIRMSFGGARSLLNGGALHPLDFIHIAIGLPGKGTKYGKSITGIDLRNLGVARRSLRTGEVIPESAEGAEFIFVGEKRFKNNSIGLAAANKYRERTGKPMFVPDEADMLDDVTARTEVHRQLREGINLSSSKVGFSPEDEIRHRHGTGSFVGAERGKPGSKQTRMHTRGIIYNLQNYQSSEMYKRIARGFYQGKTDDEIADDVADWMLKNKSSFDYQRSKDMHKYGRAYKASERSEQTFALPIDFNEFGDDVIRQVLRADALKVDIAALRELTGNVEELKFAAAYDAIPEFGKTKVVRSSEIVPYGAGFKSKELKVGQRVRIGDEQGVITNLAKTEDDAGDLVTFVPFRETGVLGNYSNGSSSPTFQQLIERINIWDGTRGVPNQVRVEQMAYDDPGFDLNNTVSGFVNGATGWMFNGLNDLATRRLERSPLFRQYYYQEVSKHVDKLSYEEGKRLYADMIDRAAEAGYDSIRSYLGEGLTQRNRVSTKLERLNTRAASSAKGTLTVRDLDDYARFKALGDTKDLLYDASTRNNFVDALRIVMPFADAWKDVVGTYLMLSGRHNIHMIRQFARVYSGAEEADPDQDGRGFFFRDPQTGEVQFSFPMSGSISKKLTGLDAPLAAPVARLSQGINVYPALGPYAQLGLSSILSGNPKYNDIKELFLPYGETDISETLKGNIVPGVGRKLYEAFMADTNNLSNTYGNVYTETLRALSVNPKYDQSTSEGVNSLLADAKSRARTLTIMRMVSQFLGPSAGVQQWRIPTKIGDQYVAVLTEQLRKFQEEDYDTAILRFENLYGEELQLYVSSKSKALRGGLEATQEFGDWTALNQDILNEYERVGAYFGPSGSDFNFTVWGQQLEEGSREKLSDREMIKLAQLRVGSAKYRAFRRTLPANLSEKQSSVLAAYRVLLNEELGDGFPIKAEFLVGDYQNSLSELRDALKDPRLAENPIMDSLRQYMEARDSLESQSGVSLKAKRNQKSRARLYTFGEYLSDQNTEFGRIWDRLLAQEVES